MAAAIRPTLVEDVRSILSIQTECGLSEWSEADYRTEIGRPGAITSTALTGDGDIGGFITGRVIEGDEQSQAEAEIYNIGVRPNFRRAGAGSRLLSAFLQQCEHADVSLVWLDVRVSNSSAIAFYSSHGFSEAGVRPRFYNQPAEDAKIMVLKLIGDRVKQTG